MRLFKKNPPEVVVKTKVLLDPNGLSKPQMAQIRKYAATGKYKVGDPLESVAYRQGQLDLIEMIENRIIAKPNTII